MSLGFTCLVAEQEVVKPKTGNIYFLSSKGLINSAAAFKALTYETFVCKLNNKQYSVHEVQASKQLCSIELSGKKLKEKAEKVEVEEKPAKLIMYNLYLK